MQRFLSPELMDDALQYATKQLVIIVVVPGLFVTCLVISHFRANVPYPRLCRQCVRWLYVRRSIRDQGIADSGLTGVNNGESLSANPASTPPPLCVAVSMSSSPSAFGRVALTKTHNIFSPPSGDTAKRHTNEHRAGAEGSRYIQIIYA